MLSVLHRLDQGREVAPGRSDRVGEPSKLTVDPGSFGLQPSRLAIGRLRAFAIRFKALTITRRSWRRIV
jgi:hypothetical protein